MLPSPLIEHLGLLPAEATRHGLLRGFDRLRRRISQQVGGRDGVFAGYDRLWFAAPEELGAGRVVLTALLLETRVGGGSSHAVAYEAVHLATASPAGVDSSFARTLLAQAVGLTVGVQPLEGQEAVGVEAAASAGLARGR